ncbi:Beta-1 [Mactra antiquata]
MNFEKLIWSNYGKFILLLLSAVVIIQGYHMMWLMKIHNSRTAHSNRQYAQYEENISFQMSANLIKVMQHVVDTVTEVHISDQTGSYYIIPNVIVADVNASSLPISLCTQTTPNHLHYLKDLSESWDGPISVAVFTDHKNTIQTLHTALYMHQCFESIRKFVTFHLLYPIRLEPIEVSKLLSMEVDCNVDMADVFDGSETKLNYANEIPYPHNALRNVAITYSNSEYIFMIDIDMVPSEGLVNGFQKFIKRQSLASSDRSKDAEGKVVYVVPAFESKLPIRASNKISLLKEWGEGNVRPFYSMVCAKCQVVTDYDKWKNLPNIPFLDIGYILDWEDPWEPFYIAKKTDLPLYDGKFKQYGFNRISQVCEMYVAGYSFAVLNNAFIVHRGLKEKDKFHSKKEEENLKNKELFRAFKLNLKDKYPDITRQC